MYISEHIQYRKVFAINIGKGYILVIISKFCNFVSLIRFPDGLSVPCVCWSFDIKHQHTTDIVMQQMNEMEENRLRRL